MDTKYIVPVEFEVTKDENEAALTSSQALERVCAALSRAIEVLGASHPQDADYADILNTAFYDEPYTL